MAQFRFTDEEREQITAEVGRLVFVQSGFRLSSGVVPHNKKHAANGLSIDLMTMIENVVTQHKETP